MRIYQTRDFLKWAKSQDISEKELINVLDEIRSGLVEVSYGAGLFKKRIATKGRGKSASTRTLLAYKAGEICVFLYGFEKNERENIDQREEKAFKLLSKSLLNMSQIELAERVKTGALSEIYYEEK